MHIWNHSHSSPVRDPYYCYGSINIILSIKIIYLTRSTFIRHLIELTNIFGYILVLGTYLPHAWFDLSISLCKHQLSLDVCSRHYNDAKISTMVSQITSLTIVYSTVYSMRKSKKTSKLRVTGLCEGNSPVTGEFPARSASDTEKLSIWWRHHGEMQIRPPTAAAIWQTSCDVATCTSTSRICLLQEIHEYGFGY